MRGEKNGGGLNGRSRPGGELTWRRDSLTIARKPQRKGEERKTILHTSKSVRKGRKKGSAEDVFVYLGKG